LHILDSWTASVFNPPETNTNPSKFWVESIKFSACFKGIFSHIQSKMQEIIQNKTPLDTLNPTIRAVAIKCLSDAGEKSN
jgi:hypothetical protein